jgi:hypothetical protein
MPKPSETVVVTVNAGPAFDALERIKELILSGELSDEDAEAAIAGIPIGVRALLQFHTTTHRR